MNLVADGVYQGKQFLLWSNRRVVRELRDTGC